MIKKITLASLLLLSGCNIKNNSGETVSSGVGYKYNPETNTYIDYSDDPLDYHYKGRDREPTEEEVALYAMDVLANAAEQTGNEDVRDLILRKRKDFIEKYSVILKKIEEKDKIRESNRLKRFNDSEELLYDVENR